MSGRLENRRRLRRRFRRAPSVGRILVQDGFEIHERHKTSRWLSKEASLSYWITLQELANQQAGTREQPAVLEGRATPGRNRV